jgi:3D (Asp-Asp-Asp) domain-containing protein
MRSTVVSALAAVATVGTLAFTATPASASPGSTLRVSQDAAGQVAIQQGVTLRGGLVNVNVASAYAAADPETFQLRNGVTLPQMDVKIAEAGNWQVDAAKAAEAMQWFVDNTTFYGGLSAVGQVSYKTVLPGGSYYAAQVNNPSATAQTFRVVGAAHAALPATNQSVTMKEPDRFVVSGPGGKLHRGPLRISNDSGELHFAQLVQVQSGTTDADITAWFAGGANPSVSGGAVLNFGTQTPGRASVADVTLPNGTYAVLDYIPDTTSGLPHAFSGMHAVVTVA